MESKTAAAEVEQTSAEKKTFGNRKDRRNAERALRKQNRESGVKNAPRKTYSNNLRVGVNARTAAQSMNRHNKAWDDVTGAQQRIFALLSMTLGLHPVLTNKELTEHYPDATYVGRLALALVAEVTMLMHEYRRVSKSHENKSGRPASLEEMMSAYETYNLYMVIMERYTAGAEYLFTAIGEQIGAGIESYRQSVGDEKGKALADKLRSEMTAAIVNAARASKTVREEASKSEQAPSKQPEETLQ